MPQRSLKSKKPKLQGEVSKKNKSKPAKTSNKHKPIAPKKEKHQEVAKLKKIITKNVNKCLEEQMRARSTDGSKVHLSTKKALTAEANRMPPPKSD